MKLRLLSIAIITTFSLTAANVRGDDSVALQPEDEQHAAKDVNRFLRNKDKEALPFLPDNTRAPSFRTVCGVDDAPDCFQRLPNRAPQSPNLKDCLKGRFVGQVTLYTNSDGDFNVNKLSFPGDEGYTDAALGPGEIYGGPRYPAAIVYAETEKDIKYALACARDSGFQVSPRGRGHHFQGMSRMGDQVVIDLSLLCDPEKFEIVPPNRPDGSTDWLLPGQKWINSIKSGAGCTNAVILAYNGRYNTQATAEGGIFQVGTCPSVGVTGYVTGGGSGDTTPYIGYGSDDLVEVDMILADGTNITANKYNDHADLFWAVQGGGSGFGIITSLTRAVIASPKPENDKERKFSYISVGYSTVGDEARKKFLKNLQNFLYDNPKSSKFGGDGRLTSRTSPFDVQYLFGLFLGSAEEFWATFEEANLLEDTGEYDGFIVKDYKPISPSPQSGVFVFEFDSYTEAMLFRTCVTYSNTPGSPYFGAAFPGIGREYSAFSKLNWCDDLGIDPSKCEPRPAYLAPPGFETFIPSETITFLPDPTSCVDREVIEKFGDAAINPKSFYNRAGGYLESKFRLDDVEQLYKDNCASNGGGSKGKGGKGGFTDDGCISLKAYIGNFQLESQSNAGGIMIPRVDVEVLDQLAKVGLSIDHFQHGAAMVPTPSDTAFPQRNTAILVGSAQTAEEVTKVTNILVKEHYKGDPSALQGYVNYPTPTGNPDWKKFYFGDNYDKLSVIKRKYDPTSVFGNPIQVQPADTDKN